MEGLSFGILRYSVTTLQSLIEDGILWVYIPLTVYMKACMPSQCRALFTSFDK